MTQTRDGRVELLNRNDSESRTYLTDLVWGDHLGMTSRDSADTSADIPLPLPKLPTFEHSVTGDGRDVQKLGDILLGCIPFFYLISHLCPYPRLKIGKLFS